MNEAERLCTSGDLAGAVSLLADAVRRRPDARAEALLVQLRHALHASRTHERPTIEWPRDLADPFPDVVGEPPEIAPEDLDADVLGGAILHHGCLLVRNLCSAPKADTLVQRITHAFEMIDRSLAGDADSKSPGDDPGFVEFAPPGGESLALQRRWVRHGGGVWGVESPRAMAEILEIYEQQSLVRAVEGYLGTRPAIAVNKFTLRHVTPEAQPSWHQDGAFMGSDRRSVNVWMALTRCGGDLDAPGLSIIPRRLDQLAETGTEGALMDDAVGVGVIERMSHEMPVVRPVFDPGDALLFDQLFLHATGTHAETTADRYAIECWLFDPSDIPDDYLAVAI